MGIVGFLLPLSPLSDESYWLVRYVNFISIPSQFFIIYIIRGVVPADIDVFAYAFLYAAIATVLVLALTRMMAGPSRGSVALNAVFVNSLNLPIPLLQVLTGSFTYAASYAAASNLAQLIFAKTLQSRLRTRSVHSTSVRKLQLIESAPLLMLLMGVVFHYLVLGDLQSSSLSDPLNNILTILLSFNFLYFGATLQRTINLGVLSKFSERAFVTTALFRMLIGPLVAIALVVLFFRTNGAAFSELLLVSMMPPAIINTALCGIYGFDQNFSARSTLILTPLNVLEALSIFLLYIRFF